MADTLFENATQMMGVAQQGQDAQLDQRQDAQNAKAGQEGASEAGATQRQKMSAQDAQKLEVLKSQLDRAQNMVDITPQIALGLVKNTGDKEWMKAVGTKMPAPVLMGMYTHGIRTDQAKRAPKITQIYDDDGKVKHAVVYTDDDGNIQQLPLDSGISPEKLHQKSPGKGSKTDSPDFKNKEAFKKSYEKWVSQISGTNGTQLKATDPDGYAKIKQQVDDYRDKYDSVIKGESTGGSGEDPAPASGGGASAPDNAPFDADAFINEALGKGK